MSNTIRRTDSTDSAVQFVMELVSTVWRRKKQFALVFCIVVACVAIATLLATREYRSQAKLFLRLGRENASVEPLTAAGENRLVALPPTFEEEMNSVMDLISSKGNVSRVVDLLGPAYVMDANADQRNTGSSKLLTAGPTQVIPVSAIRGAN